MTKEALEKEAEEYAENTIENWNYRFSDEIEYKVKQIYLAGAEPREKRITELEKEKDVIRRKADEAIADKLLITAKYNEILNDINQEKDNLQKEIAELKSRDCWKACQFTDGKTELIHEILQQQYNLTKAKEIIKKLIEAIHIWDCKNLEEVETEAEQFLKESK